MKGQNEYLVSEKNRLNLVYDLLHKLSRWNGLRRQRKLLINLSDETLKDIGLSRADVVFESDKLFRNAPVHK